MKKIITLLIFGIIVFSCKKEKATDPIPDPGNEEILLDIPQGFPYPYVPSDNKPTPNRIALGEKLFFDPILSRDSSLSCGSCHLPNLKFTDGVPLSAGISGRTAMRNSMTILNVAYQPYAFWDGGVPNLEQQVLAPIENPNEMDFDVNLAVERLKNNPEYVLEFQKSYNLDPSVYTLTRAIACYERTLFTGKSRYDRLVHDGDSSALTISEKNGMTMFFNEEGDCFHCHVDYNFTDYSFQNNGLYLVYPDSGRARITGRSTDVGKFKVPSLRNVELTAPYMHDGSMATLEEVVEHYNSGGELHPNKSNVVRPKNLTTQQKQDLVNFLKTLTDE
ncbi:MAG TPA: cytochrome c peroxidase [Bacteroidia bacterium]|jgi:cytochrome c peroxidase|nr:cytochrome-c peroxidase [Bacteroidota bacterium]MBK8586928.1 cytochrome-c peroxidase [Bacteroidota bacterium]MBP9791104.1 cytochrome-c peroxidase [Bacteroidia bacterium]MBP9923865.1 cytochrome-c peroxidase [Bacteroidia bacterium]HQW22079.1 cytochrome c peroxidase [Bacteroidia bacterium]